MFGLNISWNQLVCQHEAPQWVIFWSERDALTRRYKTDDKVRERERGRRGQREEWAAEIKREEDNSEIRGSNTDEYEAGRTMERSMESEIDGKQMRRQRERETRGRKSQLVWLIWVSCRSLGLRPEGSPTSSRTWRLRSQIHEEIHNVSEWPTWRAAAVLPTPTVNTQTHTTSSNTHAHTWKFKAHTHWSLHSHIHKHTPVHTDTQRVRDVRRTCWLNIQCLLVISTWGSSSWQL